MIARLALNGNNLFVKEHNTYNSDIGPSGVIKLLLYGQTRTEIGRMFFGQHLPNYWTVIGAKIRPMDMVRLRTNFGRITKILYCTHVFLLLAVRHITRMSLMKYFFFLETNPVLKCLLLNQKKEKQFWGNDIFFGEGKMRRIPYTFPKTFGSTNQIFNTFFKYYIVLTYCDCVRWLISFEPHRST